MAQSTPSFRTIEERRAYFEKRNGTLTHIEGSLLEIADSWKELEADPSLFCLLARDLAGEEIDIVEIYDIDCDLQSLLGTEEKIYGLVFLFECKEGGNDRAQRLYNKELQKKFFEDQHFINNKMFFALQKAPNSCATHALLSIILNSPDLPLNDLMRNFKDFTRQMTPEDRGYAIQNHCQFAAFHNRRAPATPEIVSTVMNLARAGESSRSYRTTVTRQNHFVPYVPVNGQLLELDGLKDHPISHGPVTPETFLELSREIIQHRIKANSSSSVNDNGRFSFAILAVKGSRRTRCIRDAASIHMRQTSITDQISLVVEATNSIVPKECSDLCQAFKTRPHLPYEPENVPTALPNATSSLSPLCGTIVSLLITLQEKCAADITAQKKLVETYSQRVLPPKNGYRDREMSPELYHRKRTLSFNTPARTPESRTLNYPVGNGFCKIKTEQPDPGVVDDLPTIAAVWPSNVALRTEGDISALQDVQAASAEFLRKQTKKARVTRTRKAEVPQSAPPKIPQEVKEVLSSVKSPKAENGPRSSKKRKYDNVPPESPSSAIKPVKDSEAKVNGEMIINRFTRVGGQLRSSTLASPSRAAASEDLLRNCSLPFPVVNGKNAHLSAEQLGPAALPSVRLTRSLSTQHPFENKPQVGRDRNGYVSIVKNPLVEAKSKLAVLEEQSAVVSETRNAVQQFADLELKQVDLMKSIIEENHKRVEIYNNAVRREFDYANPITALLKRFFEHKVFTAEEMGMVFPAGASSTSGQSSSAERDGPRTPTGRNADKS